MYLTPMPKDSKYYQGKFQPKNPKKYRGDFKKIVFRSSWELQFAKYLDMSDDVIQWSSEETVIGYISTCENDKKRRYFMDFWVRFRDDKQYLFEVKPASQCIPPSRHGNKKSTTLQKQEYAFRVNIDKWKAAKEFADARGMSFKVLTEHTLRSRFGLKI